MNNPLFMRSFQCLTNGFTNLQRLPNWQRTTFDAIGQRFPFDKLHHQELCFAGVLQVVNTGNIRVV